MAVIEQNVPNSIQQHNIQTFVRVYASSLDEEMCNIVDNVYQKADTSFNNGHQKDNLISTDRTSWNVEDEHQEEISPVLDAICNVLRLSFEQRMQRGIHLHAELKSSWIARSRDGAVVDPHHHGHNPSGWSFCFYAKIPSGKSSLTFVDNNLGNKTTVVVREGELLWFPSELTHYTVDTEEGRMIYSGNFYVMCRDDDGQPAEEDDDGSQ